MNADRGEELTIAEEAAEWIVRLPCADPEQREQLLEWLRRSPVHVQEFLLARVVSERLRRHAQASSAVDAAANIVLIDRTGATPPKRSVRLWQIAASFAAVATLGLLLMIVRIAWHDSTVRSGAGEWHSLTLEDGSAITLGPRSDLRIDLGGPTREVRLTRGEVWFDVAHENGRPFIVETDFGSVRALGTKFAVHIADRGIQVTVEAGSVIVAQKSPPRAVTVSAGQEVRTSANGGWVPRTVDVARNLAWVDRRLVFSEDTLSDAIKEFNKRNAIQLRVDDASISQRSIRGNFAADDPRSFAHTLESAVGVIVEDDGDVLRIVPRHVDQGTAPSRPTGR